MKGRLGPQMPGLKGWIWQDPCQCPNRGVTGSSLGKAGGSLEVGEREGSRGHHVLCA